MQSVFLKCIRVLRHRCVSVPNKRTTFLLQRQQFLLRACHMIWVLREPLGSLVDEDVDYTFGLLAGLTNERQ